MARPLRKIWQIEVRQEHSKIKLNLKNTRAIIKLILNNLSDNKLPVHTCEISIFFCNDSLIKNLNSSYRGKNKATDVLSFPTGSANKSKLLGDVVISLDTTKRQARKFKTTFNQELLRLLVHGILHLFGYEHEKVSKKRANLMWKKQSQIIDFLIDTKRQQIKFRV